LRVFERVLTLEAAGAALAELASGPDQEAG
jgi:hypothetical protein